MNSADEDDGDFGLWDGQCQACDAYGPVNDLSLCEACAGKLERDMIRQRDWAYSATAFGCPPERLEELRVQVIREYGERLELIAPPSSDRPPSAAPHRRSDRKRRRRRRRE